VTDRVNRPYKKRGPPRIHVRDSLSKTKRGRSATKKIEKIRVTALRKHGVNGQTLKDIEKKNADRAMTEKQRKFAMYWAQGETPRTAAIMAGYSETSSTIGWVLSHDPAVLKLYNAEKILYQQAMQHTRERVMAMLQEAYDAAKMITEPATMVAAAREIGKMCGFYEPEKHLHIHAGGKMLDRLNTLSDAELLKLIETPIEGESRVVNDDELKLLN